MEYFLSKVCICLLHLHKHFQTFFKKTFYSLFIKKHVHSLTPSVFSQRLIEQTLTSTNCRQ